MDKSIIYVNDRGGVSLCTPTGELTIEQVQQKDIPQGVISYVVNHDMLPFSDDDFFDAWVLIDGVVTVDFEKAKNITKNKLRQSREPLLNNLDIAFQRALENGTDTSDIVKEKQRLRDITLLPDSCSSLAELRQLHC